MHASFTSHPAVKFLKRALVLSYWVFAATLILGGSAFAIGLVFMLVFPLIPFLALPFCFMGFALASRPRQLAGSENAARHPEALPATFAPSTSR